VNNTWLAFEAEAVAASVALASRLGLPTETVVDALHGAPLVSPWQAAKLQRIARGEFSAQFALSLALKDVHLALRQPPTTGLPYWPAWLTNGSRSSTPASATRT